MRARSRVAAVRGLLRNNRRSSLPCSAPSEGTQRTHTTQAKGMTLSRPDASIARRRPPEKMGLSPNDRDYTFRPLWWALPWAIY